jgi:hypothetical protein
MSQPVKLSDALVLDARLAAKEQERSIAGQVEYWAKLGQSIDGMINGRQAAALRRSVVPTLSELVEVVDTPEGREKLKAYLETEPFPHFEAHPAEAGMLIRTEESGEVTAGRFVNREFVVDLGLTAALAEARFPAKKRA